MHRKVLHHDNNTGEIIGYLCHNCNKKFFARTNIVDDECFISNQVKYAIALELKNKISEKDIAKRYRVSPNTVERIIDSYYEGKQLYKNYLPEILSFDEFKSVKSADGAMSFHMIDGKTINIVIKVYLNTPKIQAIHNVMKNFGTSPIISSSPYFITSALSSSTSGIFALILFINLSQILSIIGSHLFLDAIIY